MFIENIADYVKNGIENGTMIPSEFAKTARIQAEQGVVGQEVVTVMQNGLVETKNTVKLDEKTGEPGWIVTNPNGEKYIVDDSTFKKKYEIDPENPAQYKPKGAPVNCVTISEDITFEAPWGGDMHIAAGGVLVLAGKGDIYGIQAEEFAQTYGPTDKSGYESLKESLEMLGSSKSVEEVMMAAVNHAKEEAAIDNGSLDDKLDSLEKDQGGPTNDEQQITSDDRDDL